MEKEASGSGLLNNGLRRQPDYGGSTRLVRKLFYFLLQVNTTLREVNIELDEKDWDERRNINKRKRLILEGKDPDEVRKDLDRQRKKERKREKKARLTAAAQLDNKPTSSEPAQNGLELADSKLKTSYTENPTVKLVE